MAKTSTADRQQFHSVYGTQRYRTDTIHEGGVEIDNNLNVNGGGKAATGEASGGSAAGTLSGGDTAGTITIGTQLQNTNTFTVTFSETKAAAPHCVVGGLTNYVYTVSTTALTITANGNTGTGILGYVCI